jgi:carboxyl-terminal processing protease
LLNVIERMRAILDRRRLRWWAGLLFSLALGTSLSHPALCGLVKAELPIADNGATSSDAGHPNKELNERLFDAVVKTTLDHFQDADRLRAIEWDRLVANHRSAVLEARTITEAAERINELLARLETSHTAVFTPDRVEYFILLDVFRNQRNMKDLLAERFGNHPVSYEGIGIFTGVIDGHHFVDGVVEGSPAASAGLKFGDEIVTVDGSPFTPISSFVGKADHKARVEVRRQRDGPLDTIEIAVERLEPLASFRRALISSMRVDTLNGKRIGYVHVWAARGPEIANLFRDALQKDFQPPIDGLIVDLRGRIGGDIPTTQGYLDAVAPRGPLITSHTRRGVFPAPISYRGRAVLLTDHHTRSAAEIFAHTWKREQIGPIIGTRTARAVSASRLYPLPGGAVLQLAVADLDIDGERLEGVGVSPDIEVERPVAFTEGADPVLARGLQVLAKSLTEPLQ